MVSSSAEAQRGSNSWIGILLASRTLRAPAANDRNGLLPLQCKPSGLVRPVAMTDLRKRIRDALSIEPNSLVGWPPEFFACAQQSYAFRKRHAVALTLVQPPLATPAGCFRPDIAGLA